MDHKISKECDKSIGLIKTDTDLEVSGSNQDIGRTVTVTGHKLMTEAAALLQNNITSADKVTNAAKNAPHIAKFRKFERGDHFAIFCDRFIEYICLSKINDTNLYLLFLQYINDDQTYSILKSVELTSMERGDAKIFCEKYKQAFYGGESLLLKNELLSCNQRTGESIDDYIYRLRKKANVAYKNPDYADESCLLAFLRGVKDPDMRIKLAEAPLKTFNDAIKLARRIERVEISMKNTSKSTTNGLKQDYQSNRGIDQQGKNNFIFRHKRPFNQVSNYVPPREWIKRARQKIKCWGCGKFNHKVANCWNTKRGQNFVPNNRQKRNFKMDLNGNLVVERVGHTKIKILIMLWLYNQAHIKVLSLEGPVKT